jgi:hypothetical protein
MRTTLTIDDALLKELRQRALGSGRPFKQVVNDVLRAGLRSGPADGEPPYRCPTFPTGVPSDSVDLRKALSLSAGLEEEALLEKLRQRR